MWEFRVMAVSKALTAYGLMQFADMAAVHDVDVDVVPRRVVEVDLDRHARLQVGPHLEEGAVHNADPDTLPAVRSNQLSCMSSGCHDLIHNISDLENAEFWKRLP